VYVSSEIVSLKPVPQRTSSRNLGNHRAQRQCGPATSRFFAPALPLRKILSNRSAISFLGFWFLANLLLGLIPVPRRHGWDSRLGSLYRRLSGRAFGVPLVRPASPALASPLAKGLWVPLSHRDTVVESIPRIEASAFLLPCSRVLNRTRRFFESGFPRSRGTSSDRRFSSSIPSVATRGHLIARDFAVPQRAPRTSCRHVSSGKGALVASLSRRRRKSRRPSM
jgi:hypothetical protein